MPDCLENAVDVVFVIDGDTIEVDIDGVRERIRFRGINTPELYPSPSGSPPQACAERAKAYTRATLGSHVELAFDSDCSSDPMNLCRDNFDRLLAYIKATDCTDPAERLVREGLARVYRNGTSDRIDTYDAAEQLAQDAGRGIWGDQCE